MNVDLAYVIGAYLSDGSAHRHKRNWIISLTVIDYDFVQETLRCIEAVTGKKDTPVFKQKREDRKDMWKFCVYSKEWVLFLWDITNHKSKIPESIIHASLGEKLSFIAGFLDGDGYVSHSKKGQYQIGFVNTQDWMKREFPSILQSVGMVVTRVTTRWPNTNFNATKPVHRVNVNVHSFVASGGYSKLKRKNDRIEAYEKEYQNSFSEAEKQRRYKRLKLVSPSETIGS